MTSFTSPDVAPEPAGLVDRVLADPPAVHAMSADDGEVGIWSTDRDCYLLLAASVQPGAHTLETGSGISTVLFAGLGAQHVCVTPARAEADRISGYCAVHGIPTDNVRFEIGCSDEVLPKLESRPLDLVLIDGNHGFPTPMIDWYYAGSSLRRGGTLMIDDVSLPAVAHLCGFLDRDPRFAVVQRTAKWCAYQRTGAGDLRQDWFEQPFYASNPLPGVGELARRAMRRVRRLTRTVR
jgi:predicted O-methyltransferase YrrM